MPENDMIGVTMIAVDFKDAEEAMHGLVKDIGDFAADIYKDDVADLIEFLLHFGFKVLLLGLLNWRV